MTKEEMINLNKLYKFNYKVAYEIEGDFDQIERLAMLSTIIDYDTINSRLLDNKMDELQDNQKRLIGLLGEVNAGVETIIGRNNQ